MHRVELADELAEHDLIVQALAGLSLLPPLGQHLSLDLRKLLSWRLAALGAPILSITLALVMALSLHPLRERA